MAKQYKVLVNTGKAENNKAIDIQQGAGDRGQPVRIKAQAGAKYQLQELGRKKPVGPDYIKTKRVGKDLYILFEDEQQASLIIEDYYGEMAPGYNGVIGQAENGSFYEYIPEDPRVPGLIPELAEGGQAVNVALGGAEVTPVGAAVAVAAFPLLGALGLLGAGAAAAYYANKDNASTSNGISGKLSDTSDLTDGGNKNDDITRDNTPTLTGTAPVGSDAYVTINGVKYPVNVDGNGNWTFQQPTALPDGTYYPILHVTQNGTTTNHNLTPFTIDTVPPAVAITNSATALAPGETSTVTFTLSEPSADFSQSDVQVEGGTLSNFRQDPNNPLKYTATFTPNSSGTSASIHVASDKFQDAAGNRNTDGAEADNTYTFKTNADTTGALKPTAPNDSGTLGDNITRDNTPELAGKVPAGTTAAKVLINGVEYPVTVNPDGTWNFTQPTALPDGTYNPQLIVTDGSGKQSTTPITPFTIDTVPPTVFVQTNASTLVSGQTAAVTFTLSEPVADFTAADVTVTGGTLSNFVQSPTDPKIYTATFTPSSSGTSASIFVDSTKFSDAAANFNTDGAERAATNTNLVSLTTNASANGSLSPASDNSTGTPNDNKTNDNTPELNGKVPAGSTAQIELNGQTYPVNVNPDGSWSFTQPTGLPDGHYEPKLIVTPANGGTPTTTPITPFDIDTTPPTIAVARNGTGTVGSAGEVISFTLSEASTDFTLADISVTGGSLGPLVQSATNPLVYTATFTPTAGAAGTATIGVSAGRFADAAGNQNLDTWADNADSVANHLVQTNNQVSLGYDTRSNNTVTPSNKTALYIDPVSANTDNILSLSEGTATTSTINGFVSGTFAAGDLISLVLNGNTYTALADANGNFTANVAVADLKADADKTIEASVTGTGGSYATAAQTYQIETAANSGKTTALSIDPVTADNIIGKTESTSASVPVNGYVSGAFSVNDTVTLTINGKTFTGKPDSTGFFSINVPGSDLAADPDTKVEGTVTGTGGTTAKAVQDYGLDTATDPRNLDPNADTTPPTIVVERTNTTSGVILDPNSKETIVFTLSEPSTSFALSDIAVTGGQLSNFVPVPSSGSAAAGYTQYTAVFTPNANSTGTATIGVASGKFADNAGNLNQDTYLSPAPSGATYELNNFTTLAYDTRATNPVTPDTDKPTVQVSVDKTSLAAGQTATLSFILSEPSTDFTVADITVFGGNGTVTNLQEVAGSNGTQYTATYTAGTTSGLDRIGVDSNTFSDAAGNINADTYKGSATSTATPTNATYQANNWVQLTNTGTTDTTSPTIIVSRQGSGTVGSTGETVVFTLSEASTNFAQTDVTVTGGTLTNWTQLSPTQYSATFVPSANSSGNASVGVAAGTFTDAANNQNKDTYSGATDTVTGRVIEDNNLVTFVYDTRTNPAAVDTTAPTIAISADKTTLTAGQTAQVTFTLSEASKDFTQADIEVQGGTLSNITPVATSGNASTGYTQYTATYTPTAGNESTGSIHVASEKFSDAAHNYNQDGADVNNTVNFITNDGTTPPADTTPPTIKVERTHAGTTLNAGATETIIFTLSEASTDFALSDVTVTGGTLSNFVPVATSGTPATGFTQYTAAFTPTANSSGTAKIGVHANTFSDNAGNKNQDDYDLSGTENANNAVTLDYNTIPADTTAPTVALSRSGSGSLAAGGSEVINIILSEASTNFDINDLIPTGGTLSGFAPVAGSGNATSGYTDYVVTFTPNANSSGTGTVAVASNKFTDAAGNNNRDTYINPAPSGDTFEANNIVGIDYNTNVADTTPPTIVVSRSGQGILSAPETIYFTLSEASTDFALGDIDSTGGQLSNLVPVPSSGSASSGYTQYQATFTPTANSSGTATIGVLSGKFSDAARNLNKDTYLSPAPTGSEYQQNNQVVFNYNTTALDTTAPTIAIEADKATLGTGETSVVTFTLSEASADFTLADIDATGGTVSNLQPVASSAGANGGFAQYTATFTPAANSTAQGRVGVAAGKFSDAAGNYNKDTYADSADTVSGHQVEVNNQALFTVDTTQGDTTPPSIVVTRTNTTSGVTLDAGSQETIIFTLSEASTTFALEDIAVTGGTLANFVPVPSSGTAATGYTQYTAVFTPNANSIGTATIGVASGKFADNAGNLNQDTYLNPAPSGATYETNNFVPLAYDTRSTNPVTPDRDAPSVQVSIDKASLAANQTATLSFILSEPSTDFTLADITVISGGGQVTDLQEVAGSNGTQYTATYTAGSTATTVRIGVAESTFRDAAGNLNADTYKGNAAGQTGYATPSGATYEANNWVELTNTGATDTTPPTIVVSRGGSGTVSASGETVYFTLSEASTTFAVGDITVTGGSLSNFAAVPGSGTAGSGYTQYSATFVPDANANGTASIGVQSSTFTDAAGNPNKDTYLDPAPAGAVSENNNQVFLAYDTRTNPVTPDTTAPTIAISADHSTLALGETALVTFTLSEASTDFTQNDVTVTGGTLTGWTQVNPTTWTATYNPTAGAESTGSVHVASNKFSDASRNYNQDGAEANNTVNFITNEGNNTPADTTPPTIVVERLGSGVLTTQETIQFTISEATKDFTLDDITVTGGTLSNLAAIPTSGTMGTGYTTYVATFTPTANQSGQATIGVAAGKFSDAAGNLNLDTYAASADSVSGHIVEDNNQVLISYNTINPAPDTTPPTVIVGRAGSAALTRGGTETVTFTLSEPSLTFSLDDVTVSEGSLTNWTIVPSSGTPAGGYTVYTATWNVPTTGAGTATVGVLSDKFTDLSGNLNKDTYQTGVPNTAYEANNKVSIVFDATAADTTPPTVEVLRSADGTITGPETIYFNFSEATTDFALADITATGGTMSNLVAVVGSGNKQYIATFTPTAGAQGTASIGVAAGTFHDLATTPNANLDTYASANTHVAGEIVEDNNLVSANFDTTHNPVDTTPPTVAISRVGSGTVGSAGDTVVFVFSEPVSTSSFTLSDVVVINPATGQLASNQTTNLSNLQPVASSGSAATGYTQYTAAFTAPTGSYSSITLGIAANKFADATGNQNLDTYSAVADSVSGHVVEANNQITLAWNTDTTTPTVTVTSSATSLSGSGTATITFTLSEASSDFAQNMVDVVGGTLSNWAHSTTNPLVYTATFTPNANSNGTATIGVLGEKFRDLAGNFNKDTYASSVPSGQNNDGNNQVSLSYDTRNGTFAVANDSATAVEAGGTNNGTAGTDLSVAATSGLLSNDSGSAMSVTAVKLASASSTTAVSSGSTSASSYTTVVGQYGTLHIGADGSYTYTVDNTNATVQALKGSTNTLSEVFTYTASGTAGGTAQTGSANLTITINGANDAPVAVLDTATAVEAGGIANGTAGTNPAGNVLTNDTDVDSGDTKTVSAITGGTVGQAKAGTYGSLTLNADGSYVYTLGANAESLLPSDNVTDTFSYTVTDAGGLSSTANLVISVKGANDAPTYTTNGLVNQNATTGSAFSYQFAGNTNTSTDVFKDVDTGHQAALTYTATLADGSSLPSWLAFNATTRTFSGTPPMGTPAGTIAVKVTATDSLGLSTSGNFNITLAAGADTTPPTIAITSNQASLSTGQTATITFTFSEQVQGFGDAGDIEVSGGTLGALTHVGLNAQGQDVYTATFTPTANSTANGVIKVAAGKFSDMASTPNANVDTYVSGANYEANNTVTLTVDTRPTTPAIVANNDTATVGEAGGTLNGTTGSALASTTTGFTSSLNVLSNDTGSGSSKTVTGIKLSTDSSDTAVSSGTTSSNGATIHGQYGALVMGADGSYTYVVNNSNATVQALKSSTNTLSEVFTYTATSGAATDTANLTITITGANDAPVGVNDTATALEKGGTANASSGIDPTGNVLTNDTDVDSGDTKTVSAITGGTVGSALAGQYGSLTLNPDGSYSYVVDNSNTAVQALRTSVNTLHDTFTYTVRDAAGLTSTATLDVTVQGANDAPTTIGTLSNTTGTVGTAIADYVIPTTGLFADVDTVTGETSTLSATLANGQALSTIGLAWDATNHKVTGTPTAAGTYTIIVKDTDAGGLSTTASFDIVVAATAPTTNTVTITQINGDGAPLTPPTLTISDSTTANAIINGYATTSQVVRYHFDFSTNVSGFALTDISFIDSTTGVAVPSANIGTLQGSGASYYVDVTMPSSGSGAVAAIVKDGSYSAASNAALLGTGNSYVQGYGTATTNTNFVISGDNYNTTNWIGTQIDTYATNHNNVGSTLTSGPFANVSGTGSDAFGVVLDTSSTGVVLKTASTFNMVQGGNYTLAFDARILYTANPKDSAGRWVLLDASDNVVTTLTGWYATAAAYPQAGATLLTDSFQNFVISYDNQLGTGNYKLALEWSTNGTAVAGNTADDIAIDRIFFGTTAGRIINGVSGIGGSGTVNTTIIGGAQADNLSSLATGQNVMAGDGNDTVTVNATSIGALASNNLLDGGTGIDTLKIGSDASTLDLSKSTVQANVQNFEKIDLGADAVANTVILNATAVQRLATQNLDGSSGNKQLIIDGTSSDAVKLSGQYDNGILAGYWTQSTTTPTRTVGGITYKVYTISGLSNVEVLVNNAISTLDTAYQMASGDIITLPNNSNVVGDLEASDTNGPNSSAGSSSDGSQWASTVSSSTSDTTPLVKGILSQALTGTQVLHLYRTDVTAGGAPVEIAANVATTGTLSGTSWQFQDSGLTAGHQYTYTAKIMDGSTTVDTSNTYTINEATATAPDTTPPTIAVTRSGSGTMTGAETITFTLSEASTDFTSADVVYSGGTLSNFQGSGTTYTATFTPTSNSSGTAQVGVHANAFKDAAGNFNTDDYLNAGAENTNNQISTAFNTVPAALPTSLITQVNADGAPIAAPTLTITDNQSGIASNGPTTTTTFTFNFSAAVSGFVQGDVTFIDSATGNTITPTSFSGSGATYTAVVAAPASGAGNILVKVADGVADLASNTAIHATGSAWSQVYGANSGGFSTAGTGTTTMGLDGRSVTLTNGNTVYLGSGPMSATGHTSGATGGNIFTLYDPYGNPIAFASAPNAATGTNGEYYYSDAVAMPNGEFAIFTTNTASTGGGQFTVFGADGQQKSAAPIAFTTGTRISGVDSNMTPIDAAVTSDGNFVVLYTASAGTTEAFYYKIINGTTGANIGSPVQLSANNSVGNVATPASMGDVVKLSDGKIAMVWEVDGTGGGGYQILNADGSAIAGQPAAGSPVSDTRGIDTVALSGGGFAEVIGHIGSTELYIYSASGARGPQIVVNSANYQTGQATVTQLTNGNIAVAYGFNGNGGYGVYVKFYDAAGNYLSTITAGEQLVNATTLDINATADGGFYLTYTPKSLGYTVQQQFDSSGASTSISSTANNATLPGGDGSDTISAFGANQVVIAGAGDDTVNVNQTKVSSLTTGAYLNGGTGFDTLALSGTGITLDLASPAVATNVKNFELIDLGATSANTLNLNVSKALELAQGNPNTLNQLFVRGGSSDVLNLSPQYNNGVMTGTWSVAAGTTTVNGVTYKTYTYSGDTTFSVLVESTLTNVTTNYAMKSSDITASLPSGTVVVGDIENAQQAAAADTTTDTTPLVSGNLSAALTSGQTLKLYRTNVTDGGSETLVATLTPSGSNNAWSYQEATALTAGKQYKYVARVSDGTHSADSNAYSINVAASGLAGGGGSGAGGSTSDPAVIAPTLTITDNQPSIAANASTVKFAFDFSEAVTGFDASDITVTNGTKGTFTAIDASHYTLDVTMPTSTASASGSAVVSVASGSFVDATGTAGIGASATQQYGGSTTSTFYKASTTTNAAFGYFGSTVKLTNGNYVYFASGANSSTGSANAYTLFDSQGKVLVQGALASTINGADAFGGQPVAMANGEFALFYKNGFTIFNATGTVKEAHATTFAPASRVQVEAALLGSGEFAVIYAKADGYMYYQTIKQDGTAGAVAETQLSVSGFAPSTALTLDSNYYVYRNVATTLPNGKVALLWENGQQGGYVYLNSDGTKEGPATVYAMGDQVDMRDIQLITLQNGGMAEVSYFFPAGSAGQTAQLRNLVLNIYSPDGSRGRTIEVDNTNYGSQDASVAQLTNGNIVVVGGTGANGGYLGFAKIYTADGTYLETVTLPAATGNEAIAVTALDDGAFSVMGLAGGVPVQYIYKTTSTGLSLMGTSSIDTLAGSDGADTITGLGGADKIYAAGGDDTVVLNADNITQLATAGSGAVADGGSGNDTLKLSGSGITLDLTNVTLGNNLMNFEKFDITGSGNNVIKLNVSDVLQSNMTAAQAGVTGDTTHTHVVQITGDAGDIVNLNKLFDNGSTTGTWSTSSTSTIEATTYNVYNYSADPSLQVLIDSHITSVNLS